MLMAPVSGNRKILSRLFRSLPHLQGEDARYRPRLVVNRAKERWNNYWDPKRRLSKLLDRYEERWVPGMQIDGSPAPVQFRRRGGSLEGWLRNAALLVLPVVGVTWAAKRGLGSKEVLATLGVTGIGAAIITRPITDRYFGGASGRANFRAAPGDYFEKGNIKGIVLTNGGLFSSHVVLAQFTPSDLPRTASEWQDKVNNTWKHAFNVVVEQIPSEGYTYRGRKENENFLTLLHRVGALPKDFQAEKGLY